MNTHLYAPHESLGFMTTTAGRLMNILLRRKMKEAGIDLTGEQWGVLVQLWNRDGITQEELAHVACVDKSSMSRVLAVMAREGLITRGVDPADARRKLLHPSEKAWKIKERGLAVAHEALAKAFEGISPQEHAVCLNVLALVKKNLRKNGR